MFDLSKAKIVTDNGTHDAPAVEPITENTEVTAQETPVQETPVQENQETPGQDPIKDPVKESPADTFPAERFKGKFNNWDEVESFISKEPENPFKDDFIKKVVDKYNNDGSLKEFFEAHATDWNKVSDEEVLRRDFFESNSDLDEETLNLIWKRELAKYNIDPEEFSEEEVKVGQAVMKRDANNKRKERIEKQQQLLEPAKQQVDPGQDLERVKKVVNGLPEVKSLREEKKVKFIFDGNEFNYEVGDTEEIIESMADENRFFSKFIKDGKLDTAKWSQVMAFAMNPEKFLNEFSKFNKGLGKEELVTTELKNTSLPGTTPSESQTPGDFSTRLAQAFKEKGRTVRN